MNEQLTAIYQKVSEGYIGFVEELPGANTQGATLEEVRANLQEAVQLVLEANRTLTGEELRDKTVIREPLAVISGSELILSATWKKKAYNSCAKAAITVSMGIVKPEKHLPCHAIVRSMSSWPKKICKDLEVPTP